jgi:hypothetical protein
MMVSLHKVVSFRFVMYDAQGNMLENNHTGSPVCYLHGGSTIEISLQKQLEGLSTGYESNVLVQAGECQYHIIVMIEGVREATQAEILLGYPMEAGEICDPDCECYIPKA